MEARGICVSCSVGSGSLLEPEGSLAATWPTEPHVPAPTSSGARHEIMTTPAFYVDVTGFHVVWQVFLPTELQIHLDVWEKYIFLNIYLFFENFTHVYNGFLFFEEV